MSNQPPPLPRKRILVVDDDPVVVKAISLKLSGNGYQVVSASDGSEAIRTIREERPDLILLDIMFPPDVDGASWDGFRIMEWMHRMDESLKIPVIIITGAGLEKNKQRSNAIGAAGFFLKPIDNSNLLKTIHEILHT